MIYFCQLAANVIGILANLHYKNTRDSTEIKRPQNAYRRQWITFNISIRFGDRKNLFGPPVNNTYCSRRMLYRPVPAGFLFYRLWEHYTHTLTLAYTEGQHNQSVERSKRNCSEWRDLRRSTPRTSAARKNKLLLAGREGKTS